MLEKEETFDMYAPERHGCQPRLAHIAVESYFSLKGDLKTLNPRKSTREEGTLSARCKIYRDDCKLKFKVYRLRQKSIQQALVQCRKPLQISQEY